MRLENVRIFDTARRCFRSGSITFSDRIESVEYSDADSNGAYVVPGFLDIHMHIESSMMTPSLFARATLPHGTTTIVSDCHEISNVAGVKGLEAFMEEKTDNDTYFAVPSSVPASSSLLETSGGAFDGPEIEKLSENRRIIALGEVMNANDLLSDGDNRTKRIIKAFRRTRPECPLEGHIPRLMGSELERFISSGVDSDHTEQKLAGFLERLSKGVFVQLQYKGFDKEIIDNLDPCYDGHFSFCTDDVLPDVLESEGHLDRVVRKAISLGLSPERAIYAVTWSPAVRMRLFDRGWLAPGKIADIVVLDDVEKMDIRAVYKNGRLMYEKGRDYSYSCRDLTPEYLKNSIDRAPVTPEDFILRGNHPGKGKAIVIAHQSTTTMTKKVVMDVEYDEDCILKNRDLNILASVERYGRNAPIIPVPLAGGLDRRGAICSSWAHDSHNLLVLATDAELAARAVNLVIEGQGGVACVDDSGEVFVPLGYGGIVSSEDFLSLAAGIRKVRSFLREHGYEALDEVMSFAVLALPVSPEVKVTDKGLVDVREKKIMDWRLP